VLTAWKQNPTLDKKELGVVPRVEGDSVDKPLTERELRSMRTFLEKQTRSDMNVSSTLDLVRILI